MQGDLTDSDWSELQTRILEAVGRYRARGVVLDVTDMDVLDSYATRTVQGIVKMVRLRGARTVITGIQPGVALAMVELGLDLGGAPTCLELDQGLALLSRSSRARR